MAHYKDDLNLKGAAEVLRDGGRDSYGVIHLTSGDTGRGELGAEVEYQPGDEALVEAGKATWVVAPVHLPSAGRRLDSTPGAAEKEASPLGGIEVFPPAEPTTPARRSEARFQGYVEAHTDEGLGEKLAAKRAEAARSTATGSEADDVKAQAAAGGLGARTGGGITAADLGVEEAAAPAKRSASKSTGSKES